MDVGWLITWAHRSMALNDVIMHAFGVDVHNPYKVYRNATGPYWGQGAGVGALPFTPTF